MSMHYEHIRVTWLDDSCFVTFTTTWGGHERVRVGMVRPAWGGRWQARAFRKLYRPYGQYERMAALGKFATEREAREAVNRAVRAYPSLTPWAEFGYVAFA